MMQMSSQREKELRRLIYLRNELIKEAKKEIKQYREEIQSLNKTKVNKNKRR